MNLSSNENFRMSTKKPLDVKMNDLELIVCFPGDRLCASNENTIAGVGTYERSGYVYASLAGTVNRKNEDKVSTCGDTKEISDTLFFVERSDKSKRLRQ